MKSRAAFLALIFFVVCASLQAAAFKDVPINHWAYDAVVSVSELGIISGYPDGTFRGADFVSRYQLAVAIYRTIQYLTRAMGGEEDGTVVSKEVLNEIDRKIQSLRQALGTLESELGGKVKTLDAKTTQLSFDVAGISESVSQIRESVDDLKGLYKTLSIKFGKVDKDVTYLLNEVKSVNSNISTLEKVIASHDKSLKDLYSKLEYFDLTVDSSMVSLKNELKHELGSRIAGVEDKVKDMKADLEEVSSEVAVNAKNIEGLEKKLSELMTKSETFVNQVEMAKRTAELKERIDKESSQNIWQWVLMVLLGIAVIVEGVFLYQIGGGAW